MRLTSPSLFELYCISRLTEEPFDWRPSKDQRRLYEEMLRGLGLEAENGRATSKGKTFGERLLDVYGSSFLLPDGNLDDQFMVGDTRLAMIKSTQPREPVLFFTLLPDPYFEDENGEGTMFSFAHDFGLVSPDILKLIHDLIYDGDDEPYDSWVIRRKDGSYIGRSMETLSGSLAVGDSFEYVMTDKANWILQLSGSEQDKGTAKLNLSFYATNTEQQAFVDSINGLRFKLSPLLTYTNQVEKFDEAAKRGSFVVVAKPDYYYPEGTEYLHQKSLTMSPEGVVRHSYNDDRRRYIALVAAKAHSEPIGIWPLDTVSPWLMHHRGGTLEEHVRPGTTYTIGQLRVLQLRGVLLVSMHMFPHSR